MGFILTLLHVIVCMALIIIILLQAGKGAGMGAAFGGSSQTVFGSTGGATFLTKVTIAAAIIFGMTSLGLSFLGDEGDNLMEGYKTKEKSTVSDLPIPAPSTGGEKSPGKTTPGEKTPAPAPASDIQVPDVNKPKIHQPEESSPAENAPPENALNPDEAGKPGRGPENSIPPPAERNSGE